MRVLFLTQWFYPEPGALRGLPLAKWLVDKGHEVQVLTGFPNYPGGRVYPGYRMKMYQRESIDGVEIFRVPLYPSHDTSALRRIANYLSFALSSAAIGPWITRRPDVAYVYHPPPTVGLSALMSRWLARVPFVYHIADMWPESVLESGMVGGRGRLAIAKMISCWCNLLYRGSSAITVLSPGFKRMLVERGVPAEKVHVVFNWTEEELFRPLTKNGELARSFGLGDKFVVLYAGNLGIFQGLETVLNAALLLKDHDKIRFVFAGTGQREAALKEMAAALSLRNVTFLGRRDAAEMPEINALADVLLVHLRDLPFFGATIPSKTQVSLASGKPILMAVAGDAANVVRDAAAGLVCKPQNPAALAETVLQFFGLTPKQLDAMGLSGRQFYQRHMSLEIGAQAMEQLFIAARAR